jgi:glycogen(starch) synthase
MPHDILPARLGRIAVTGEGITFFHVSPEDAIEAGLRLVSMWCPDVIHLHSAWLWHVARALRQRYAVPIVFTVHSLDRAEYEQGGLATPWEVQETVIAEADQVVVISQSERNLVAQYCPGSERRVRVVGNGIDDAPLARAAANRPRGGASPTILYCGRFVERKGIRELLEALPLVLAELPGMRVVLVGGYGSGDDIERRWMTPELLPYRDRARFTGWLSPAEVASAYAAADILVVPSWYEPFGMVILEGMLYGLAIAAAAVGGPAEILEDERTALLFPPRAAEPLTRVLLRLGHDAELRTSLAVAAAREVRRRWLWPTVVRHMRAVYEGVIGESRLRRLTAPSCTNSSCQRTRCRLHSGRDLRRSGFLTGPS